MLKWEKFIQALTSPAFPSFLMNVELQGEAQISIFSFPLFYFYPITMPDSILKRILISSPSFWALLFAWIKYPVSEFIYKHLATVRFLYWSELYDINESFRDNFTVSRPDIISNNHLAIFHIVFQLAHVTTTTWVEWFRQHFSVRNSNHSYWFILISIIFFPIGQA